MTPNPRAAADLRRAFLDYFVSKGHVEVPSSPLVPHGDPTLLFTTAGMVQFKPFYTATGDVPYTRATSVQKSLRLTDLDNVGLTPRHDTFFEMLGNFSFGPREKGAYFKAEAIAFAWEFVTRELELSQERLYASVFAGEGKLPRDDEAVALWKKMGLPESRIVFLGRKDNFWGPAGGRGACGPCSEIYFDLGERRPDYLAGGAFWGEKPGDDGDRFMEFWNLVFPQFDAQADGTLQPLARPGIDTGMGLERLALILQGKNTIFETDLFAPLIDAVLKQSLLWDTSRIEAASGPYYDRVLEARGGSPTKVRDLVRDARIIADHVRALTFAIAEGALPGNEGAGYVLRRLLRRAVTKGRSKLSLQIKQAFLPAVAERAIVIFGGHYHELVENRSRILKVIQEEEASFVQTYETGVGRLGNLLTTCTGEVSGSDAFALHDTYGFPIELTEELAREAGVRVNREGFERAMREQRDRARAASKFAKSAAAGAEAWTVVSEGADSEFIGYDFDRLLKNGLRLVLRRWRGATGNVIECVFDRTPCYAESGGQVADVGEVIRLGFHGRLTAVYREAESVVHRIEIVSGSLDAALSSQVAGGFRVRVDRWCRFDTMRNHTATHLLHAALRSVLGEHVRQAGSLVEPARLRFDYTHFEAPGPNQLLEIQKLVNRWIGLARPVRTKVMTLSDAKELGAMALFGEKYGEKVRLVRVAGAQYEDFHIAPSLELCGGTHVGNTGQVLAFYIATDESISSGVRRIEALTGEWAQAFLFSRLEVLERTAKMLQAQPDAVPEQVQRLRSELAALKKTVEGQSAKKFETTLLAASEKDKQILKQKWTIVVTKIETPADVKVAREAADRLRDTLRDGASFFVFPSAAGGPWSMIANATTSATNELGINSNDLMKQIADVVQGSGGGKPQMAIGGTKDPSNFDAALELAWEYFRERVNSSDKEEDKT